MIYPDCFSLLELCYSKLMCQKYRPVKQTLTLITFLKVSAYNLKPMPQWLSNWAPRWKDMRLSEPILVRGLRLLMAGTQPPALRCSCAGGWLCNSLRSPPGLQHGLTFRSDHPKGTTEFSGNLPSCSCKMQSQASRNLIFVQIGKRETAVIRYH